MGGASGTYRSHCWRARGTSVEPIFDSRPEYLFSIGIFMMGGVPAHMSTVGTLSVRPWPAPWSEQSSTFEFSHARGLRTRPPDGSESSRPQWRWVEAGF